MTSTFQCSQCGKSYEAETPASGGVPPCPSCAQESAPPLAAAGEVVSKSCCATPGQIYCASCGTANPENNYRCAACGADLHAATGRTVVVDDGGLGALIPYKNAAALAAYYLGVFSLIPCLGIPLGVAAIICGIVGLKRAKEHPEAKGKVHAWVGIGLGAVCVLANFVGIIAVLGVGK